MKEIKVVQENQTRYSRFSEIIISSSIQMTKFANK